MWNSGIITVMMYVIGVDVKLTVNHIKILTTTINIENQQCIYEKYVKLTLMLKLRLVGVVTIKMCGLLCNGTMYRIEGSNTLLVKTGRTRTLYSMKCGNKYGI